MEKPDFTLLKEGLAALGFDGGSGIFPALVKYIEEIELFNPAYGLVKVKNREELIVKHILDSLAPAGILKNLLQKRSLAPDGEKPRQIADAGSGAGFPGIPLAICMGGAEFTLIERMGRRAGFLRNVKALLRLPNIKIEESEMEKLPLDSVMPGGFDMLVLRAFRPLEPNILKGLVRLLANGGIIAAYKGRRESVEEEMSLVKSNAEKGLCPAPGSWESLPLKVPFLNEERHLLVIRP